MNVKTAMLHIFVPLMLGAVLYYIFSPDVVFVKYIDSVLGWKERTTVFSTSAVWMKFIRFYLLDMLWAYSLIFTLFLMLGNNTVALPKCFWIGFAFSNVMEILQMIPAVKGTFDRFDILVEFLAELAAVFIIKNYSRVEELTK